MSDEIYTPSFFEVIQGGSVESANVVVPLVVDLLHPTRVLDVGCGEGAWLAPFAASGAQILGLDGDYVDRDRLLIPAGAFRAHDLSTPVPAEIVAWGADLALCLEVAEHLPADRAVGLIADLTACADTLLFSAAVPGQGGYGHINEQPHEFWITLLEDAGFAVSRVLQRRLAADERIAWWYRNNLLLARRVSSVRAFPSAGNV